MENIKTKALEDINVSKLAQFLALSGMATLLPFLHLQWVTGPMVNAILILCFLVGIRSALILCLVPSLIALGGGLLPPILAPVVLFIMISNTLLLLPIDYFMRTNDRSQKSYFTGLIIGASAKFLFLYFSVGIIGDLLIKQELLAKVTQMMSWPQLFTSFSGGFIAFLLLKMFKKIN